MVGLNSELKICCEQMCHNPSFVVPLIEHWKSRGLIILKGPQIFKRVNITEVQSLGQEDSLEKGMATLSNIHAWRMLWTEEPGGIKSTGVQRVGHN